MPRTTATDALRPPKGAAHIQIPHLFTPRSYQKPVMQYMDAGGKRALTVWHRRAGKDLLWLNQTIKAMLLPKFCGTYLYIFPTLTQGRRDLWDAKTSPDSGGRPFRAHFPPELVMEASETEMQITLRPMPHQNAQPISDGRGGMKTVGSIFQVMGTDKDSIENIRGINAMGAVFSEYADQNSAAWESIIEPILMENGGWAAFDFTPKGNNHAKKLWDYACETKSWFTQLLTIEQTFRDAEGESGLPVIDTSQIEALRAAGRPEEIIQQEYYCFPPETLIHTSRGQVPIIDLRVGDTVLTHAARWRAIKEVMQRPYSGPLMEIETFGVFEPLRCTPEHPVQVLEPTTQEYEWVEAQHLQSGMFAVMPRLRLGDASSPVLDGAAIELLAWYITEGSMSKTAVQYTLGAEEHAEAKQIVLAAERYGADASIAVIGSTLQVQVRSTKLADLCASLCGVGAAHKRIPLSLISSYEQDMFDLLMRGDGCEIKQGWAYTTVSRSLAHDVQVLAGSLGYRAGISRRPGGTATIQGRRVQVQDSYLVQIRREGTPTKIRPARHGIGVEIRAIRQIPYSGQVYNLRVAYDESYIAAGRSVHNCSFEGFLEGTIYGDRLKQAINDGRVGRVPWVPNLPVGTMWDIGRTDATAIWFFQIHGSEIRFIDYYANVREGAEHYAKVCQQKPYLYGLMILPHDARVRGYTATESTQEFLERTVCRRSIIAEKIPTQVGIDMVRRMFPRFVFDEVKCEMEPNPGIPSALAGMRGYHRKWDEDKGDYSGEPVHDRFSHPADALRTGIVGWPEGGMTFAAEMPHVELKVETEFEPRDMAFMGRR